MREPASLGRSYHSPAWGLKLSLWPSQPGDSHASRKLSLPSHPQPSLRGASHQGDEVGECEGQRDLHTLPLVCRRPELLVVAFLFKQVPN